MSADGRYIAFASRANNLVSGDTNSAIDIFAYDRVTGAVERISVDSSGAQSNGSSSSAALSADGRFVAFRSTATNLVAGDTNARSDVFLRDRQAETTTRVSVSSSGAQANDASSAPSVSEDGRYICFSSAASNLVSGDTNARSDVFVRDRVGETTVRVSTTASGGQVSGGAGTGVLTGQAISADGRYVAMESDSTSLVPNDSNGHRDIFVKDVIGGGVGRISGSGSQGNADSTAASISADGKYVSFVSSASDLVTGDTNAASDVFRADVATASITRVSIDSSGAQGNGASSDTTALSSSGRYVAFTSSASNLVAGDTNGSGDVFVRDTAAATTSRIDVSTSGAQTNPSDTRGPVISSDGRRVAFFSFATNLVTEDTNGQNDVFLRDRAYLVPDKQTLGSSGAHAANPTATFAEPVNTATGNYTTEITDATMPGIGLPFEFVRSYNSEDPTAGPLGPGWTHSLNVSLSIAWDGSATLRGEDGQQVVFTKQADGSLAADPGGRSTLRAVAGGFELTRTDQIVYTFGSSGRLTTVEDRSGNQIALSFNASNRLSDITDSAGRSITLGYDSSSGLLTSVSLPGDRSVSYSYTSGRLSSVTDISGETTSYTYDSGGRLATITDQADNTVLTNTFGSDGRIIDQADVFGNHTTFAWDPATQTATMTDSLGKVWKDIYDNGFLAQRQDPFNKHLDLAYDTGLNPTEITDRLGKVWQLSYDARGNVLSRTAPPPLSFTQSWTYDAANNPRTYTDGRNNTWEYDYDATGRLTTETQPDDSFRTLTYTAQGQLATASDFLGNTTSYTYDTSGNLTEVETPSGSTDYRYSYDPYGGARRQSIDNLFAPENRMRYTGQLLDAETNLYDLRARLYDPGSGRFLTPDPLEREPNAEYIGAYVYADNRPTTLRDPSGMRGESTAGPAWQALGGLGAVGAAETDPWLGAAMKALFNVYNENHNEAVALAAQRIQTMFPGGTLYADAPGAAIHKPCGVSPNAIPCSSAAGLRPDIVVEEAGHYFYWEVKPNTEYGVRTGRLQLLEYQRAFGNRGAPGPAIGAVLPQPDAITSAGFLYVHDGPIRGLIFYEKDQQQVVREAIRQANIAVPRLQVEVIPK